MKLLISVVLSLVLFCGVSLACPNGPQAQKQGCQSGACQGGSCKGGNCQGGACQGGNCQNQQRVIQQVIQIPQAPPVQLQPIQTQSIIVSSTIVRDGRHWRFDPIRRFFWRHANAPRVTTIQTQTIVQNIPANTQIVSQVQVPR